MEREKEVYKRNRKDLGQIILPFIIYYLVYLLTAVMLTYIVNWIWQNTGEAGNRFFSENGGTVHAVLGGAAMLFGILPVLPDFWKEVGWRTETGQKKYRQKAYRQIGHAKKTENPSPFLLTLMLTVILALTSSITINILFDQIHLVEKSDTYAQVADSQYSVLFPIGLFLYGIVSPLAEEIVFRGITYNRMKKCFPVPVSILFSALLFGVYHGNIVQGIYGLFMGMLIAYSYEKSGHFFHAFLFHGAANAAVYTITKNAALYQLVMTPFCGGIFAILSFGILLFMRRSGK